MLQKMVKIGSPQQAKHAIRCIETLCKNKVAIFEQIFEVSSHLMVVFAWDVNNIFLVNCVFLSHKN